MAIRITRIDDIDGSDGAEAIAFEIDHKAYEIDLCARNRIRFLRAIEPFIDRARLVEDSEEAPTITTIVRRASDDRIDNAEDSLPHNSGSERESGGLDLFAMARQFQG
jgi:hypothetical protein